VLGASFNDFNADIRAAQQQISEHIFKQKYEELKEKWPQTVPYLEEQLSPNVRFWAGYNHASRLEQSPHREGRGLTDTLSSICQPCLLSASSSSSSC